MKFFGLDHYSPSTISQLFSAIDGQMIDADVQGAEVEVSRLFCPVGIDLAWTIADKSQPHRRRHFGTATHDSLAKRSAAIGPSLGRQSTQWSRAFVDINDGGYLEDTYYKQIQLIAAKNQLDPVVLFGHVMAHEIGHLLLGPGQRTCVLCSEK